ncbi:hypothetical protein Q5P01_022185 [Channa striata]|uniref:Uncharacterized protein n=1 Tax=Channa striata TaxID=64152 RepID=A0AA88LRB6_CHASR|nr:hypothetical protein Q5P01_022185 [Channa striata]
MKGNPTSAVSALSLPEPGAPSVSLSHCCHSDARLSRRSNSFPEPVKEDFAAGFPLPARGGSGRDMRPWVKSEKEKETETESGRSAALPQLRVHNSGRSD